MKKLYPWKTQLSHKWYWIHSQSCYNKIIHFNIRRRSFYGTARRFQSNNRLRTFLELGSWLGRSAKNIREIPWFLLRTYALCVFLEETKKYFKYVKVNNDENGRNRVMHGFVHPRFWSKENFEQLIHHIAVLSPYSKF